MLSDNAVRQFDRLPNATSRLVNTVLGGREEELLSSQIHREQIEWARAIVDRIFSWETEKCCALLLREQRYKAD